MPQGSSATTPLEALASLRELEAYLRSISSPNDRERPVTENDVRATLAEAKAELSERTLEVNAFILAYMKDEPIPLKFFHPWGSKFSFNKWEAEGLKLERFNGKVMVRPSVFFAFVEESLLKQS